MSPAAPAGTPLRRRLRLLYDGDSAAARRFRIALLAFDVVTVLFFLVTALLEPSPAIYAADFLIATVLIADFAARLAIAQGPLRFFCNFTTIADLVVIVSLLAPMFVSNLGFLRVARMLRLMRSYHVLREFRRMSPFFRSHENVIQAAINLSVFIFVVTAVVFVVEAGRNPDINNYTDALYFTVTTLTTTGFGDITMKDPVGRLLAVVIMLVGVGLFLRLVQTIFRPTKVFHRCPDCGLERHDLDAVHCKHCGVILNIPNEGEW